MAHYTALDDSEGAYDEPKFQTSIDSKGSYNIRPHTAGTSMTRLASNRVIHMIRGSR